MTIILFIVDTSASMAQKSYQGISTLDLAKSLVDALLKVYWAGDTRDE
uniref:VWFA domain-containing protein n=1 Tax=Heterorhabditis bacteriophora TaxID=37862 RepID=A0A1I7W8L1_HETBA